MRRLLGLLVFSVALVAGPADLKRAEFMYQRTDYEGAIKTLQDLPAVDALGYFLIGKSYFMLGDYKKATDVLMKASALDSRNSDIDLWLGRSYGRRAETASPLFAPANASKARQFFEKAVELNPGNREALNDLFDYYLEAPGFLGGGQEKAEAVARKIAVIDPAEGYFAMAQLAERRKQFGKAEEHLRRAVSLAPRQVGRVIDLAKYLAKQGRYQESDAAFQQADRIAPNAPKVIFAKARTFIESKRHLDDARLLLNQYLESNITPEDPPKAEAEKLLRKVTGA